jgi:hypothetical protein
LVCFRQRPPRRRRAQPAAFGRGDVRPVVCRRHRFRFSNVQGNQHNDTDPEPRKRYGGSLIEPMPTLYRHHAPRKTTEAASRRPHWQRLRGSAWPEPPSTLMVAPICFRSISTVFRRRSFATTRKDAFRFSHAVAEKLQQRATTSPDRPRRIPSAPPCRMVWGACAWADSRAAKGQQRVISQGLPTQTAALQSAAGHAGKEP